MKNFSRAFASFIFLSLGSSCAVSMKMQGNRFQSSEVYGRTAIRVGVSEKGQSNVELTPDQTYQAPETNNPNVGPTHVLGAMIGAGIDQRFEVQFDTPDLFTGKFQILGDSKQTAKEGNFSLSVAATAGGFKTTHDDTDFFDSTKRYVTEIDRSYYGLAAIAGYRVHDYVNFYAGPFSDYGKFSGTYTALGVPKGSFNGTSRNKGGVLGVEIGKNQAVVIAEAVWNQTTSAYARRSFWLGGLSVVLGFGTSSSSESPSPSSSQ